MPLSVLRTNLDRSWLGPSNLGVFILPCLSHACMLTAPISTLSTINTFHPTTMNATHRVCTKPRPIVTRTMRAHPSAICLPHSPPFSVSSGTHMIPTSLGSIPTSPVKFVGRPTGISFEVFLTFLFLEIIESHGGLCTNDASGLNMIQLLNLAKACLDIIIKLGETPSNDKNFATAWLEMTKVFSICKKIIAANTENPAKKPQENVFCMLMYVFSLGLLDFTSTDLSQGRRFTPFYVVLLPPVREC